MDTNPTFSALRITENPDNTTNQAIVQRSVSELPPNDTLIRVAYSALNYKDALSANGNRGVTRNYPHTPGIDAAGTVVETTHSVLSVGQEVIVTGYDLGMNTDGGFAEYIRVPGDWAIPLPDGLTAETAMAYGTAGLTAAMCIDKLLNNGLQPADGEVVVTGATGGVGTMAVQLLTKLGFSVVAVTGKPAAADFLTKLGAKRIISREEATDLSNRPLLKGIYAGVVDTVGGPMLAGLLKSLQPNGAAAMCGLVGSADVCTTVYPFILRGIALFGVDSAEAPKSWREKLWQHLATDWKPQTLTQSYRIVTLDNLLPEIEKIYNGQQTGKVVVDLGA